MIVTAKTGPNMTKTCTVETTTVKCQRAKYIYIYRFHNPSAQIPKNPNTIRTNLSRLAAFQVWLWVALRVQQKDPKIGSWNVWWKLVPYHCRSGMAGEYETIVEVLGLDVNLLIWFVNHQLMAFAPVAKPWICIHVFKVEDHGPLTSLTFRATWI